jgi:hypothetical protein
MGSPRWTPISAVRKDLLGVDWEPDLLRVWLDGGVVPPAGAAARHVSVVPTPALPVPLGGVAVGIVLSKG